MENLRSARGGTLAPQKNYRHIPYKPELAEEFSTERNHKQPVSGRFLAILYQQLSYWSRYARHIHNGRRYFWKSAEELSKELNYSRKQIVRGLKALEELKLIQREKLRKKYYNQVYFYHLPKSPHTAEVEVQGTTSTQSSSTRGSSRPAEPTQTRTGDRNSGGALKVSPTAFNRETTAPAGTSGGTALGAGSPPVQLKSSGRGFGLGHPAPINSKRLPSIKLNTLKAVLHRCAEKGGMLYNELTDEWIPASA